METKIDRKAMITDNGYIEFLMIPLNQQRYVRWRDKILEVFEDIVSDFRAMTPEEVMEKWDLNPHDIALFVRLNYFTPEEVEEFDVRRIEAMVPQDV